MIIVRAPHRVSLFGGGTDYPDFISEAGDTRVVGFAIAKYAYVCLINNDTHISNRFRISYSTVQDTDDVSSINHPIIREAIKHRELGSYALHISSMSEIPSGTGLGTSSAFTVALLEALNQLTQVSSQKLNIAKEAIFVERELVGHVGGIQDQYWSAFGGIGSFCWTANTTIIEPASHHFADIVQEHGLLIHIGETRLSSSCASHTLENSTINLYQQRSELKAIAEQAARAINECQDKDNLFQQLKELMKASWERKKMGITQTDKLSRIVAELENNNYAFKLLGAGGTGFIFILADNIEQKNDIRAIAERLDCKLINIKIDYDGVKRI